VGVFSMVPRLSRNASVPEKPSVADQRAEQLSLHVVLVAMRHGSLAARFDVVDAEMGAPSGSASLLRQQAFGPGQIIISSKLTHESKY